MNRIKSCFHSDQERQIYGTWVTEEVKMALQFGYVLQKIICVWHWKQISDSNLNLFDKYVDTFLKQKQQNSSYPSWVQSTNDQDIYIKDYLHHENIELEKDKIQYNEGR